MIQVVLFYIALLLVAVGILSHAAYWSDHNLGDTGRPLHHDSHIDDEDHLSVVIPVLNEGATLATSINHLFFMTEGQRVPTVVVVHAGSDAHDFGPLAAEYPTLHFVRYPGRPSRGAQLNFGAAYALRISPKTSSFLFLHADTLLPRAWDTVIRTALSPCSTARPPALASFSLSLPPPISPSLRLMLWGANVRAKWGRMPYGDQGYFLTRRMFDAVGGFPSVPIMEDIGMLRAVARIGPVSVVDESVKTSVRRWKKKGVLWNTVLNQMLIFAWMCGVHPETIYRWYYGRARGKREG